MNKVKQRKAVVVPSGGTNLLQIEVANEDVKLQLDDDMIKFKVG